MGFHPRIESSEFASFLTTRSRNSELWFINNLKLEHAILGYLALNIKRHAVKLYGIALEGSHIQGPAHFPHENRGAFMRDFNSAVARAVIRHAPTYPGGTFWQKRYSAEFLPSNEDIEEYFFYTALQPIKDGLVEKLSDYPWYHFFHDAIHGIERKFQVVNWKKYNLAKKRNRLARIKDFTEEVVLKYERIPGYEHLSQKEYAKLMQEKFEDRRLKIVKIRRQEGLGFLGKEKLLNTIPGTPAKNPKRSTDTSHRPRILSVSPQRRAECEAWYFDIYFTYKAISQRYLEGELDIEFPKGTYKPHIPHRGPPILEN